MKVTRQDSSRVHVNTEMKKYSGLSPGLSGVFFMPSLFSNTGSMATLTLGSMNVTGTL